MAEQGSDKLRDEFLSESQEIIEQAQPRFARDCRCVLWVAIRPPKESASIRTLSTARFGRSTRSKGLAGLSGVERMMHMAHHVENLLDALRLGKVLLTLHVLDLLFESIEHAQLICAEVADHGLLAASPPSALVDDFTGRGQPRRQSRRQRARKRRRAELRGL